MRKHLNLLVIIIIVVLLFIIYRLAPILFAIGKNYDNVSYVFKSAEEEKEFLKNADRILSINAWLSNPENLRGDIEKTKQSIESQCLFASYTRDVIPNLHRFLIGGDDDIRKRTSNILITMTKNEGTLSDNLISEIQVVTTMTNKFIEETKRKILTKL